MMKASNVFENCSISHLKTIFTRNFLKVERYGHFKKSYYAILQERGYKELILTGDEVDEMQLTKEERLFFKVKVACELEKKNENTTSEEEDGEMDTIIQPQPPPKKKKPKKKIPSSSTRKRKRDESNNSHYDDEEDGHQRKKRKKDKKPKPSKTTKTKVKKSKKRAARLGAKKFLCDKVELANFLLDYFVDFKPEILEHMINSPKDKKCGIKEYEKLMLIFHSDKIHTSRKLGLVILYMLRNMFLDFHPELIMKTLTGINPPNDPPKRELDDIKYKALMDIIFQRYKKEVLEEKNENCMSFYRMFNDEDNMNDVMKMITQDYENESIKVEKAYMERTVLRLACPNKKVLIRFKFTDDGSAILMTCKEMTSMRSLLNVFCRTKKIILEDYNFTYKGNVVEKGDFTQSLLDLEVYPSDKNEVKNGVVIEVSKN